MCSLLAPVIEYVHAFASGNDGDGAAVLVSAHAAEVHPEVLLGALAPVVLLNLRIETNVIKPSSKEVSKTQHNTVSFVTRKRGGTSMLLPSWQR